MKIKKPTKYYLFFIDDEETISYPVITIKGNSLLCLPFFLKVKFELLRPALPYNVNILQSTAYKYNLFSPATLLTKNGRKKRTAATGRHHSAS